MYASEVEADAAKEAVLKWRRALLKLKLLTVHF